MGNSVIYRPAYDAEVEYLESDGNSYIDTGLKASSELGILAHIQNSQDKDGWAFGGNDSVGNKELSFAPKNELNQSLWRFDSYIILLNALNSASIYELSNIQNHNVLKIGESTYTATNSTFESQNNLSLFARGSGPLKGVRIYDFKIYQNSTLVRDFIPVRIGSVGYMYDKVSKQLFANKGTGNFILGNDVSNAVIPQQRCVLYFGSQRSVGFERIYEEYEWLIIPYTQNDANALPIKSNNFSYQYIIYSVGNIAGLWTTNTKYAYYPNSTRCGIWGQSELTVVHINSNLIPLATPFDVECNSDGITMNGELMPNYGSSPYFDRLAIYCYTSTGQYALSKITVDGSVRYVPCKLLQSIPAILDGNGIARQAGECGMWDKVSNRFYGNVANSGTFTVEGPKCYEEYKWLVGDGSAFLSTTNGLTGLNSVEWELSGNGQAVLNSFGLTTGAAQFVSDLSYVDDSIGKIGIYDNNRGYFWTTKLDVNTLRLVSGTTIKAITINDVDLSNPNYQWNGFFLLQFINRAAGYKVSKVTVDDVIHYVPCKLTHGIPASMDANGIARPAGTCGMWDKVNDKFYGNVANSGSFTVSND